MSRLRSIHSTVGPAFRVCSVATFEARKCLVEGCSDITDLWLTVNTTSVVTNSQIGSWDRSYASAMISTDRRQSLVDFQPSGMSLIECVRDCLQGTPRAGSFQSQLDGSTPEKIAGSNVAASRSSAFEKTQLYNTCIVRMDRVVYHAVQGRRCVPR